MSKSRYPAGPDSATSAPGPKNGTEMQMWLLRAAKQAGWLVQMTRRSHVCRTESSSGFPDLFMVRGGDKIVIECKSRYEKLTDEQVEWHRQLALADVEVFVLRPADYDIGLKLIGVAP